MSTLEKLVPVRRCAVLVLSFAVACAVVGLTVRAAAAEDVKAQPARRPVNESGFFPGGFSSKNVFTPSPVAEEQPNNASSSSDSSLSDSPPQAAAPAPGAVLPPEQTPVSVLNPDAPTPFKAMVEANRGGDKATAAEYADQYVRYMQNLMFEVREYTQMIGEAMIRNGMIDEESWVGVEQYLDYELAQARSANGSPLSVKEEAALKRIVADKNGEAQVYYFFTINNSYSRMMAADIERLWQIVKSDPKLKMVALTLRPEPKEWIDSYRQYTGLTIPIYEGSKVGRTFRVAFVPTVVVVAPSTGTAYMRTGQQNFQSLYRLIRTVQGQSPELSPAAQRLLEKPIGELERAGLANGGGKNGGRNNDAKLFPAGTSERSAKPGERF